MNLREYLMEYRAINLDIMEEIWQEGQIISLLDEREKIIKAINEEGFKKDEIINTWNSLNLTVLEKELEIMYKKEIIHVKNKLEKLKKARNINSYNNIENISRVFNKSV